MNPRHIPLRSACFCRACMYYLLVVVIPCHATHSRSGLSTPQATTLSCGLGVRFPSNTTQPGTERGWVHKHKHKHKPPMLPISLRSAMRPASGSQRRIGTPRNGQGSTRREGCVEWHGHPRTRRRCRCVFGVRQYGASSSPHCFWLWRSPHASWLVRHQLTGHCSCVLGSRAAYGAVHAASGLRLHHVSCSSKDRPAAHSRPLILDRRGMAVYGAYSHQCSAVGNPTCAHVHGGGTVKLWQSEPRRRCPCCKGWDSRTH